MRKYLFIIVFLIIFLLPICILALPSGDVDGDGKINTNDYVLLRKYILKSIDLTEDKLKRADVDNDGKVNSTDYILVRKKILNNETLVNPTPTSVPIVTPSPTPMPTATPTPTPTIKPDKIYIEAYFLNTMNNKAYNLSLTSNDTFLFKTSTGKYVLLDAGKQSEDATKMIYDKLKELQKNDKVTIDYFIISHMHSDHYGNANAIMNSDDIEVKNLIIKEESKSSADDTIIDTAGSKGINIIRTNKKYKDGSVIKLDSFVNMYFFNVEDIYGDVNADDCSQTDYYLQLSTKLSETDSKTEYAKTPDGKYIYFEGSDYINNNGMASIHTSSTLDINIDKKNRANSRTFFVIDKSKSSSCSPNGNSIAIVFQVKTDNGNRYMYLPSDLENDGYNPLGEKDTNYNIVIHGHVTNYHYRYKMINGEPRFILDKGNLITNPRMKNIKRPAEYLTANKIVDTFKDFKTNLVIYQQAHHGVNNSKESLDVLNVNRKGVYSIVPRNSNPEVVTSYLVLKTQYYLSNTTKLYNGIKEKNGVKCTIKSSGTTSCKVY